MKQIVEQIKNLEAINSYSKHEQIVQGVINAIDQQVVTKGDLLPSVTIFMSELGFARETIAKAYKELIHRGIVESKNRLGYFVATTDVKQELKVALVLFAFDAIQETFYENFRKGLGKNIQLDIFFHHNNFDTFENIIQNCKGKYGMFVIAPIPNEKTPIVLKLLPTNRVLLVDRFIETDENYNFVAQEFGDSSYKAFVQLKEKIEKYEEVIFFFKPWTAEPRAILDSFKRFLKDHNIRGVIKEEYEVGSLEKGKVYFTIHNLELWEMLKDSKIKGFKIGKDVGFISHNDDIIKEIIFGGISTFSTDFAQMGRKAADFVLRRNKIQEIIPSLLVDRNSL
jgi:DNA-binding transcriptional regulator YhcF (GntR family)